MKNCSPSSNFSLSRPIRKLERTFRIIIPHENCAYLSHQAPHSNDEKEEKSESVTALLNLVSSTKNQTTEEKNEKKAAPQKKGN